ncbi:MAG TPA: 3D domain-containing protein, partial [Bdellovibrionota bacterium]
MRSNKKYLVFILGIALSFIVACGSADADSGDPEPLPPNLVKVGDLKPTFYWVALETNDGQPRDQDLLDLDGRLLARISASFLAGIKMEGTGRMLDGRIINFHARVGTEIRWRFCPPSAPYGYGLEEYALKPFRSVAVDPTVVPIPSKVYIPAAKGAKLPDGTIHDGYFEAVDIGQAIQNQRIDIFTAMGDQSEVFKRNGLSNMKPT